MKCIDCGQEAEYIFTFSLPLSGVTFATIGGSYCSKCFIKAKELQKAEFDKWIEFHKKIEEKVKKEG